VNERPAKRSFRFEHAIAVVAFCGVSEAWCSPRTSSFSRDYSAACTSPGFTHLVLSGEERRLINMHRNLERHLNLSEDLPEAERINDNTADQNVLT
jgi:hypothetical protein